MRRHAQRTRKAQRDPRSIRMPRPTDKEVIAPEDYDKNVRDAVIAKLGGKEPHTLRYKAHYGGTQLDDDDSDASSIDSEERERRRVANVHMGLSLWHDAHAYRVSEMPACLSACLS